MRRWPPPGGTCTPSTAAIGRSPRPCPTWPRTATLLACPNRSRDEGRNGMPLKVRDIIKMIEADGWALVGTRGSHRQYKHPSEPGRVTIPGKPSRDLPPGLERSILKQAGLMEGPQ